MRAFILDNLEFQPTKEQEKTVETLLDFLIEGNPDSVFLLRGYAGTGKTTLVGALVRAMNQLNQRTILMASTGRAAKVFSMHTGQTALTIHKRIYRQKTFTGEMTDFLQGVNFFKDTLFIVDEASMISNGSNGDTMFGTGRLLDDLVQFVYSGAGCRLMLVGDQAQLPPVGEDGSPALSAMMLGGYGLQVYESVLTEVVRQLEDSGILWNATMLRHCLVDGMTEGFPHLKLTPDVVYMPGSELIEALEQAYYQCGNDQVVVITRSNVRANAFNQGIRGQIFCYDTELDGGDRVIIVKNNYHWVKPELSIHTSDKGDEDEKHEVTSINSMDFIANGDMAVVRRFRNERSLYGFRFADVMLEFPDYDNMEVLATVVLDTLHSEGPALTSKQQECLFQEVWNDYPDLATKRERMKAVREDTYYNALQIKYGYAVTCHKAQGGQWQQVFVDQGFLTEEMMCKDYFRWLYTALTRATDKVYLVNWPKAELDEESARFLG